MIDLRSDTVTKPSPEMIEFMMKAELGDDVFSEDPTVNLLELELAEMFGKEAGLFCSSGTMTNQIAIKVHTNPGDEVICHRLSHIYNYEGGGIAFNSAASVRLIEGGNGNISAGDLVSNINAVEDYLPRTRLVSVEDTCNKAGGSIMNFDDIKEVSQLCKENELAFHLDGARLFNRLVASPIDQKVYGSQFDSISICLSKGLAAPVGSVLLGDKEFIRKARRIRKVMGGGMRQAGIVAAAGLFAIRENINALDVDHQHARIIAEVLSNHSIVNRVKPVETNIIVFELKDHIKTDSFVQNLEANGILAFTIGPQTIRFVLHRDVSSSDIELVLEVLSKIN